MENSRLLELFRLEDPTVTDSLASEIKRKGAYDTLHSLIKENTSRRSELDQQIATIQTEKESSYLHLITLISKIFPDVEIQHYYTTIMVRSGGDEYVEINFRYDSILAPLDECRLIPIPNREISKLLGITYSVSRVEQIRIHLEKTFIKPLLNTDYLPIRGNSNNQTLYYSTSIPVYLQLIQEQYGISLDLR